MTNKESLREKFEQWEQSNPMAMFSHDVLVNFFWNEIEQIRKENMEKIVGNIEKLNIYEDQSPNFIRDEILAIIKQSHE